MYDLELWDASWAVGLWGHGVWLALHVQNFCEFALEFGRRDPPSQRLPARAWGESTGPGLCNQGPRVAGCEDCGSLLIGYSSFRTIKAVHQGRFQPQECSWREP